MVKGFKRIIALSLLLFFVMSSLLVLHRTQSTNIFDQKSQLEEDIDYTKGALEQEPSVILCYGMSYKGFKYLGMIEDDSYGVAMFLKNGVIYYVNLYHVTGSITGRIFLFAEDYTLELLKYSQKGGWVEIRVTNTLLEGRWFG